MICLYGAGRWDNIVGRNLIWKANVDFKTHHIKEFVEKDDTRDAFEDMLDNLKKGDMVIITSVAAFDDGSDFSIMRKIRRLEGIGVKMVVETEENFSYAAYETWYRQKKEIEEARDFFKSCCT